MCRDGNSHVLSNPHMAYVLCSASRRLQVPWTPGPKPVAVQVIDEAPAAAEVAVVTIDEGPAPMET